MPANTAPSKVGYGITSIKRQLVIVVFGVLGIALSGGPAFANEDTTFIDAVRTGVYEDVEALLTEEAMQQTDKDGNGAVIIATARPDGNIMDLLLNNGGDIHTTNIHGLTALMSAAYNGRKDFIRDFVRLGADLEIRNASGMTALLWAARSRRADGLLVLIELGADMDVVDNSGNTAMIHAAFADSVPVLEFLAEHGVDLNQSNPAGQTPLIIAADRGSLRTLQHLLDNGADPDQVTNAGESALMFASHNGHLEVVQALIAADADRYLSADSGQTALSLAEQQDETEIFGVLSPKLAALERDETVKASDDLNALRRKNGPTRRIGGRATNDAETKSFFCSTIVGQTTFHNFQMFFEDYLTRETARDPSSAPGQLLKPLAWTKQINPPPEIQHLLFDSFGQENVDFRLADYVSGTYTFGHIKPGAGPATFTSSPQHFVVLAVITFGNGVVEMIRIDEDDCD